MDPDFVTILDGSTFVTSGGDGDIACSFEEPQGFFYRDTRFLSAWQVSVRGTRLQPLSTAQDDYFAASFFLCRHPEAVNTDADVSFIRHRFVSDGFHEDVVVLNHSPRPIEIVVDIAADADFADVFEVHDGGKKQGEHYRRRDGDVLVLGYRRDRFVRETYIWVNVPAEHTESGLSMPVVLEPHGRWEACIEVRPRNGTHHTVSARHGHASAGCAEPRMEQDLESWIGSAPRLETSWRELEDVYRTSIVDLASLRFYPEMLPEHSLPAAGAPWYMALFGRDSVITSLQCLPFLPELARTTLHALADRQGTTIDAFRDEEPGKILHEYRVGELTVFGERPQSPYFGSADATLLWLVLLDETIRWTGDQRLASDLEHTARAALHWIDRYADHDGDGFVDYRRRAPTGFTNQGWKDSEDAICFADGSPSVLPRATCELQGYTYDAKRRMARIAREVWHDDGLAERLDDDAAALKVRFNEKYWLPDREIFALAIDGKGRRVDAMASNMGHLLWSGIVDEELAPAVAERLMAPAMFTGWGVRTLAETEASYNPLGYHLGTVWPHDNSIIVAGLRRYGFDEEASRLAVSMLEAAVALGGRLPEVFAGYPRSLTEVPVRYPSACSPQAWASGTPLSLLHCLLDLQPDGSQSRRGVPGSIEHLALVER